MYQYIENSGLTMEYDDFKITYKYIFVILLTALGFRPIPSVDMTLVRFIKADPTSYSPLTDNLEAYLQCKYYI